MNHLQIILGINLCQECFVLKASSLKEAQEKAFTHGVKRKCYPNEDKEIITWSL